MRIERPDSVEIARWLKLSELPGCWLEITCCRKAGIIAPSLELLRKRNGDCTIGDVVDRLICTKCGGRPRSVYLNETQNRKRNVGAPPGWSIQLKGKPDPD